MISFLKKYWGLVATFLISFAIFYPSLFVFYTNDDFFFLKISGAKNLFEFLNFFNLFHNPNGFAMYRPLTTQTFYFLAHSLFNLNPMPLHIISFILFFAVIFLVYILASEIFMDNKIASISAFLYATSATHFAHLYYLATFQELGVTFFVLLSCLSFLKNRKIWSLIFFILALMSKETAVVTPALIGLIYVYRRNDKFNKISFKSFLFTLVPFAICLFAYLLIRFHWYGIASGDTYIWDFSLKKLVNTVAWYLLWVFNIPETLLDFIGPGLQVNPNLFLYWAKEMMPILILFLVQMTALVVVIFKYIYVGKKKKTIFVKDPVLGFCSLWFLITLLPVVFLPLHKFTFYLTLPLIGVVFRVAYLLKESKIGDLFIGLFLIIWTTLAVLTVKHTINTNWITQGEDIAQKSFQYISKNLNNIGSKKILFVDTPKDTDLPWSPTDVVKTALSDKNFFFVYFPTIVGKMNYLGDGNLPKNNNTYIISSRLFLNY